MLRSARRLYIVLAWMLTAGLLFQVFLAGLGVFNFGIASRGYWDTHRGFGSLLGLLPLMMLVLSPMGRFPRNLIGKTALLFILFMIVFVSVWIPPTIAGFHPLLGFSMFLLTWHLARQAGKFAANNPVEQEALTA